MICRVPRCFERLEAHPSEFWNGAIAKRSKCIRRSSSTDLDDCTYAIAQLQMSSDKIGVQMCQQYVLDPACVFGGKRSVLRVNDGCACLFVSDNVGGVR